MERFLRTQNYAELGGADLFLLYAEGWLFVRYAFQHADVKRQLDEYLNLINRGVSYEEATRRAFPNLDQLNSRLFDYAHRSRFEVLTLPFRHIEVGPIEVRQLRPAEEAMFPYDIRLSQGYPAREAQDFADDVRAAAAPYPDDPYALEILMEAEHLAGNDERALATAEHLLGIDPRNGRALAVKGLVAVAALRAAQSTDHAAWNAARQPLEQAIQAAPSDAVVLSAYYQGFRAQGILTPPEAQNALYNAMLLAPSDSELRYMVARDFEERRMIPEAIAIIRPNAYTAPDDGHESPAERRRRERREQAARRAGREVHESALEMLNRLTARLSGDDQESAAAPEGESGSASGGDAGSASGD